MKKSVHFILQAKGGIGKSFVASILAQYAKAKGDVMCFDTDQENTTFSHYSALEVIHVPVMTESRTIDAKRFDAMIERIIEAPECTCIVDNGANTFSPLLAYIVENDVFTLLSDCGIEVYIHTIIGGGDTLIDTANGFESIARGNSEKIVVWLNEHFGPTAQGGKQFVDTKLFNGYQEKITGVVLLPHRNPQTSGDDIRRMNIARLTFAEVMDSPKFGIMEKQRLKIVQKDAFAQLDKLEII